MIEARFFEDSSITPEAPELSRERLLGDARDLRGSANPTPEETAGRLRIRRDEIWFRSIHILIGNFHRAGILDKARAAELSGRVSPTLGADEADRVLDELLEVIEQSN